MFLLKPNVAVPGEADYLHFFSRESKPRGAKTLDYTASKCSIDLVSIEWDGLAECLETSP